MTLAPDNGGAVVLDGGLSVRSAFFYGGATASLLPRAKNPLEPPLYRWLVNQAPHLPDGSALIPVPGHWRRRVERGGCHSTALAQILAARLDLPVIQALERPQAVDRQAGKDVEARQRLAPDSFRYTGKPLPPGELILIDDVMTTGTTLGVAARCLVETEEAQGISAWVLARRV